MRVLSLLSKARMRISPSSNNPSSCCSGDVHLDLGNCVLRSSTLQKLCIWSCILRSSLSIFSPEFRIFFAQGAAPPAGA